MAYRRDEEFPLLCPLGRKQTNIYLEVQVSQAFLEKHLSLGVETCLAPVLSPGALCLQIHKEMGEASEVFVPTVRFCHHWAHQGQL